MAQEVLDEVTRDWLDSALSRAANAAEKDATVTATVALVCTLSWNVELASVEVKMSQREGSRMRTRARVLNGQLTLEMGPAET